MAGTRDGVSTPPQLTGSSTARTFMLVSELRVESSDEPADLPLTVSLPVSPEPKVDDSADAKKPNP